MKCDAYARLRHQIKKVGAKPKPTPSAAAPSFGSIQTASEKGRNTGLEPCVAHGPKACVPPEKSFVAKIDFENAAVSRVFRFIALGFAFANDSETEIVARKIQEIGAAGGRAQTGEARLPTAAA